MVYARNDARLFVASDNSVRMTRKRGRIDNLMQKCRNAHLEFDDDRKNCIVVKNETEKVVDIATEI